MDVLENNINLDQNSGALSRSKIDENSENPENSKIPEHLETDDIPEINVKNPEKSILEHKVFIYGTLKNGDNVKGMYENESAKLLGKAVTKSASYDLLDLGPFPTILKNGKFKIQGEIWHLSNDRLKKFDKIESVGVLYSRDELETSLGKVWCYFLLNKNLKNYKIVEKSSKIEVREDDGEFIEKMQGVQIKNYKIVVDITHSMRDAIAFWHAVCEPIEEIEITTKKRDFELCNAIGVKLDKADESKESESWTHKIHLQPYSDKQMYEAYNTSLENLGLRFTRLGLRRFLSMKPFFVERDPLKLSSYFYDCDICLNIKNLVPG